MKLFQRLKGIGPGVLVAAAFVGPGTITACTLAGVNFGYGLLWALLLSILATMALQEMAARLGIVTNKGLIDVIRTELDSKWARVMVFTLVLGAILVGNAAYEAGNLGGATLGLTALVGDANSKLYPAIVGFLAFALLWTGNYKLLEKVFLGLILVMSLSFVLTAILTKPNFIELIKGLLVPTVPQDGILTVIALVGTTIVPYNLFLHASLVNEKWQRTTDLEAAKWDTWISIGIGGLVSMAIVIAATSIQLKEVNGVMELALGLEPLFGESARYFMGIGLFVAGITSAITAPLAAAYVANSCFGWEASLRDWKFRLVWIFVLVLGVILLSFDIKPIQIIKFAQIANGILLPLIAIILVWMANRTTVLGKYKNTLWQNVIGLAIIVLTLFLGVKSILKVIQLV